MNSDDDVPLPAWVVGLLIVAILAVLASLVGCSSADATGSVGVHVQEVTLADGTHCAVAWSHGEFGRALPGGLSCNWQQTPAYVPKLPAGAAAYVTPDGTLAWQLP